MAQDDIKKRGGENIWVETSSRPLYKPTQQFYLSIGCIKEAELPDFYGKDDNKIIYRIKAWGFSQSEISTYDPAGVRRAAKDLSDMKAKIKC